MLLEPNTHTACPPPRLCCIAWCFAEPELLFLRMESPDSAMRSTHLCCCSPGRGRGLARARALAHLRLHCRIQRPPGDKAPGSRPRAQQRIASEGRGAARHGQEFFRKNRLVQSAILLPGACQDRPRGAWSRACISVWETVSKGFSFPRCKRVSPRARVIEAWRAPVAAERNVRMRSCKLHMHAAAGAASVSFLSADCVCVFLAYVRWL